MAKQTFTTGQVLTAAQMTSLQQTAMGGGSTTAKTTSYVLVAADAGTVVQMNSASATTITVNTALFAAGDTVQIQNVGSGVCTVTAGTATVSTSATLALKQYDAGTLYFNTTSAAIFFAVDAADGMANVLTTTGDIIYSSSGTTAARLGIGTTGQVLNVASGIPSWVTPAAAASGLTLVNATSFSAVANTSTTFDGVFTTTYETYMLVLRNVTCSAGTSNIRFNFRYGSTTETAAYYGINATLNYAATANNVTTSGAAYFDMFVTSTSTGSLVNVLVNNVAVAGGRGTLTGTTWYQDGSAAGYTGVNATGTNNYTGFILTAPSGTITGKAYIYGLQKA